MCDFVTVNLTSFDPLPAGVSQYYHNPTALEKLIKEITKAIVDKGHNEEGTLVFTAAFTDTHLFLRECYKDIDAFHVHLKSVEDVLQDFFAKLELEHLVIVADEENSQLMKEEMSSLGMDAHFPVIAHGFAI